MKQPAAQDERLRRLLDVQDPGAGGHPLRVAVRDEPAAAVRVLVLERAVDHVGDRLETTMWVPGRALRLTGRVLDLAHLVEVHERIEIFERDAGEGAADREPLPFEPVRGVGDAAHGADARYGRIRFRDPRQDSDVIDDDGGHGVSSFVLHHPMAR